MMRAVATSRPLPSGAGVAPQHTLARTDAQSLLADVGAAWAAPKWDEPAYVQVPPCTPPVPVKVLLTSAWGAAMAIDDCSCSQDTDIGTSTDSDTPSAARPKRAGDERVRSRTEDSAGSSTDLSIGTGCRLRFQPQRTPREPTPTTDDCADGGAGTQRLLSPKSRFTTTCHFHLSPETVVDFKLVPKLIGKKGRNVKHIWEASGCKLRIRGHGSGHLEGPTMQEARVALQMVLSAETAQSLDKARAMVAELLRDVSGRFAQYCKKAGVHKPTRLYTIVDGRN